MFPVIRRVLKSRWAILIFGIVLLAFIVTGVGGSGTMMGGALGGGEAIARVGDERITAADVTRRVEEAISVERQQNPTMDMARFVAAGGVERVVDQLIASTALEEWGRKHGFGASAKAIDGEIASVPAFNGPTGKFDQAVFEQILSQRRINPQQLRADVAGDLIRRQMLVPVAGGAQGAVGLVTPYAALMLESRTGSIGLVPAAAVPAPKPATEAEVAAHYGRNIARYTAPERRVLRYAVIARQPVAPSEAEVAAYYNANRASYAGGETRTLSQVILPDQAAATALARRIAGGTPFAAAAQAAGFAPADTALGDLARPVLAERSSPAVADAAFALPQGGTTAAVRSPLGWHVVRVDRINRVAARPLDAVRGEIAALLGKTKSDEALADRVAKVEDAIAEGSSFDDVVAQQKLTVVTTPPLAAQGTTDVPGWTAPPELAPLLAPAFQTTADEDPTVETITADERFALLDVTQVIPAAPRPLAQVRAAVATDLEGERRAQAARTVAQRILARTNAGAPVARAFAEAGVKLPPPERATARQMDLARAQGRVPAPLALLFSLAEGDTRLLAAPDDAGWYVVDLERIERGDPASQPGLIDGTRREFAQVLANEYAEQFARAAQAEMGVTRDAAAVARLKAQLTGSPAR